MRSSYLSQFWSHCLLILENFTHYFLIYRVKRLLYSFKIYPTWVDHADKSIVSWRYIVFSSICDGYVSWEMIFFFSVSKMMQRKSNHSKNLCLNFLEKLPHCWPITLRKNLKFCSIYLLHLVGLKWTWNFWA